MQFGLFTEFEPMAEHSEQEAFCTSLVQQVLRSMRLFAVEVMPALRHH